MGGANVHSFIYFHEGRSRKFAALVPFHILNLFETVEQTLRNIRNALNNRFTEINSGQIMF